MSQRVSLIDFAASRGWLVSGGQGSPARPGDDFVRPSDLDGRTAEELIAMGLNGCRAQTTPVPQPGVQRPPGGP